MGILSKVYTGKKVKDIGRGSQRPVQSNRPASTLPKKRTEQVVKKVSEKEVRESEIKTENVGVGLELEKVVSAPVSEQDILVSRQELVEQIKEAVATSNYQVSGYDKEKYEAELKEFLEIQIQTVIDQQASKYEQRLEEYKEALSLYKKCLSVFEDRLEEIGSINVTATDDGYKDEMLKGYEEKVQTYDERLYEYDETVKRYDSRIGLYDDKVRDYDARLDEYDEKVRNYDSKLGQYDEAVKGYEEKVQTYDERLYEYDETVKRYDSRIGLYDDKVRDYDARLDEYDEKVRNYDSKLGQYDEAVKGYDSKLGQYDEAVKGYDSKLGQYDEKVRNYDSRLGVYDEKVRDYDSRLGEYDERVRGYDVRLEEYTQQLRQYEDKLANYQKQNINDQETARKINADIAFIKAESEKIKKQIEEIKIAPDEEFSQSIEKMLNNQVGVGEFIKNFDARVKAIIKEDAEEKKKVSSYQFDMIMDTFKKKHSTSKQLLMGVLGVNFIILIFNIILLLLMF